jgi:putative phosphoribosyl transferase
MPATGVHSVRIPSRDAWLAGTLTLPPSPRGLVLFAHGSGSSRSSPRNVFVADCLRAAGVGTLLFDLLTADEDRIPAARFDIGLLATRLATAARWAGRSPFDLSHLPLGLFGASTGAAAALRAAVIPALRIRAIVSRGGRPDLAGADALAQVAAPTLLIVGGFDPDVLGLNREAYSLLRCPKSLEIVPGATHLFEEPGTLEHVAALAAGWFGHWLGGDVAAAVWR